MAGKDILKMSQEELKRLHVIHKVIEGVLKQTEASEMLLLGKRQVRRVREEGDEGIRLFRTFQDRVVKEMRLRGIKTIEEANRFLSCNNY